MAASIAETRLPARYRLIAPLGVGSMGAVSRVTDRLTGQDVALKQVVLPEGLSADEVEQELLSLAHEFRVLAGLRHPHIISVLDYGFDAERRPFYTMELLEGARDILTVGGHLPSEQQRELLLQVLEALAYLHRRGVLHHDLKPANILVADGRVRLLDFGLAVLAGQPRDDDAFGTLQYLAPEVLDGQPYTEAADLYSLGVIAYELLLGRHPVAAPTVREFLRQVHSEPPDLTPLAGQPALAALIGRLLAKAPGDRPPSAADAIDALRSAAGLARQGDDAAIRESYLQAATFVGRARELATLSAALAQAGQGQGSAWLVGGESGVGKSRLLDELRTQALVSGFQVLRGQAVQGGGLPYQLWREPLRALLLSARDLDDATASALLQLVPDAAQLLGRQISEAPPLEPEAALARLFGAIARLFAAQRQPVLLVLEDLQWAEESLLPLPVLLRQSDAPWIVVGSYRSDERPGLPQQLPAMRLLELPRLDAVAVAALSGAILGESGHAPELAAFLTRETEGNAFFAIELLRALAEQTGQLGQVGRGPLPVSLLPQGIHALVQRRLAKVPAVGWPLLERAAIAGRAIDPALLELLAEGADVVWWLQRCAEAAVLTILDGRWQFSHDKLREAVIASVPPDRLAAQHRRVAETLAQLYGEQPAYAATIASHWQRAHDPEQEARYAELAGDHARAQYLYQEALEHYQRAYDLRAPLASADDRSRRVDLLVKLASRLSDRDTERASALAHEASALSADPTFGPEPYHAGVAESQYLIGRLADRAGQYWEALPHLDQARDVFAALGRAKDVARVIGLLGHVYWSIGDYARAEAYALEVEQIGRAIDDRAIMMHSYISLAMVCEMLKRPEEEIAYEQQALRIAREIGDREAEITLLNNHTVTLLNKDRIDEALGYALDGLQAARALGDEHSQAMVIDNLVSVYMRRGEFAAAEQYLAEGRALLLSLDMPILSLQIDLTSARLRLSQGDPRGALAELGAAIAALPELSDRHIRSDACLLLEETYRALGDAAEADRYRDLALASGDGPNVRDSSD